MTFETREQYLAWRAEWRASYANTSQKIRENRTALVKAAKAGEDQSTHQRKLSILRDFARGQMETRTAIDAVKKAQMAALREAKALAALNEAQTKAA